MEQWGKLVGRKRPGAPASSSATAVPGYRPDRAKKVKKSVPDTLDLDAVTHLTELTAKLSLQTAATSRRLAGEVEHVLILPVQHPVAVEMLATGVLYMEGKKNGDRKWAGAPHHHVWAAMIRTLIADASLPEQDRRVLQQHSDDTDRPEKLSAVVNTCMARKTRDVNKAKITLHMHGIPEVEKAVVRALVQGGAIVMNGAAPRSGLEREIGSILQRVGAFER